MVLLPDLISDLALILIVAGITTIIFQKLKQPLVLGYIVAGFIAGPYFELFFTVSDKANIHTWSELGVIFLLFALGLEFNMKKLTSVGHTAFITASTEVTTMLALGFLCGQSLGWNTMDSIFLGGMLSMSSTTIIIKAFDDLKLRGQRFTELVFGSLIIEDIAGIVMMVMLSTIAVTSDISHFGLLTSVIRLVFFLVLWFILGIFIVPWIFRKVRKVLNSETLLIVSLGLCLGMVIVSNELGFSTALGAFIMGSILSETPEVYDIEKLLESVKDLFGSVFFVSVGMMVDPAQLLEHWFPIVIITILTILGKLVFSTSGMLLSGQDLYTSIHGGFSLAQIGEFAFIIAGLGQSLNITSSFLYPIVVSVSVITTFTTPYCIALADPFYNKLNSILPQKAKDFLERYTGTSNNNGKDHHWKLYLQLYLINLLVHVVILSAITYISLLYGNIISKNIPGILGLALETVLPLIVMAPFLRALLFNIGNKPELFSTLWFKKKTNRLPLTVLLLIKVAVAITFVIIILFKFLPTHPVFIGLLSLLISFAIYKSDWLLRQYLRIKASFIINLNENHLRAQRKEAAENDDISETRWLDEELFVSFLKVADTSKYLNIKFKNLAFREKFGINILQIIRQGKIIDIPGGEKSLQKGDAIVVIGTNAQLDIFTNVKNSINNEFEKLYDRMVLKDFLLKQESINAGSQLLAYAIIVNENSSLLGKTIKDANIRNKWHCLVLGLEKGVYYTINPHISQIFEKNDIIWVIGKDDMIAELARNDLI